jgi:hypothetical protein
MRAECGTLAFVSSSATDRALAFSRIRVLSRPGAHERFGEWLSHKPNRLCESDNGRFR